MLCRLLTQVATLCGIFYMYENEPVAYSNAVSTLVKDQRSLSCFTKDASPRLMTSQSHVFLLEEQRSHGLIELPVIYNKHYDLLTMHNTCMKPSSHEECDDDDDENEDEHPKKSALERKESNEIGAITKELYQRLQPTRNPAWPTPTPFRPEKRAFLKDKLTSVKKNLLSGNLSPMQLKQEVKKIQVINQKIARENVKEVIQKQRDFAKTKKGMEAVIFCSKTGASGNTFQGCMQDMRLTHDKKIAAKSVQITKKALLMNNKVSVPVYKTRMATVPPKKMIAQPKASAIQPKAAIAQPKAAIAQPKAAIAQPKAAIAQPKAAIVKPRIIPKSVIGKSRVCTATGDPHFTNFNGEYFHLQEPSIFVFAKSKDGLFEVQVRQDGAHRVGEPSYVREVKIRYGNNVYTSRFSGDGFIVNQEGTSLSVTVPGSYEGSMMGICGEDTPLKGAHNYKGPDGIIMNVNYGKPGWEMGGYGGPNTLLSKWHLSWKPSIADCLFNTDDCKINLGLAPPKQGTSKISIRRRG